MPNPPNLHSSEHPEVLTYETKGAKAEIVIITGESGVSASYRFDHRQGSHYGMSTPKLPFRDRAAAIAEAITDITRCQRHVRLSHDSLVTENQIKEADAIIAWCESLTKPVTTQLSFF